MHQNRKAVGFAEEKQTFEESGLGNETEVVRCALPLDIRRRARRVTSQPEISSESL